MLGVKQSADFDDNNWNYKRSDNDATGDFPHIDFDTSSDSDSESVKLPSSISTARFNQILNHNSKPMGPVPELQFKPKPQPEYPVHSSTPVGNSPIFSPMAAAATAADINNTMINSNNNNDLMKLVQDQSAQLLALQTQLTTKQHLIDDLKDETAKLKSHLESKTTELTLERRTHSQLKDEFNTLSDNYRNDREQWGKLVKSHEFELGQHLQSTYNLNSKIHILTDELDSSIGERDSLLNKLDTTSKERIEWLEKYETLKSQMGPVSTTKPLESQFGSKFQQLDMGKVDILDKIEAHNIIKNMLFSFNVSLESLKDYVIFIRDDVMQFFNEIHKIIHGSDATVVYTNVSRVEVKECMNVLIRDVKSLHRIC